MDNQVVLEGVTHISFRGNEAVPPLAEGLYRGEVIECNALGKNSMSKVWYLARIIGGDRDGSVVRVGIRGANASK